MPVADDGVAGDALGQGSDLDVLGFHCVDGAMNDCGHGHALVNGGRSRHCLLASLLPGARHPTRQRHAFGHDARVAGRFYTRNCFFSGMLDTATNRD